MSAPAIAQGPTPPPTTTPPSTATTPPPSAHDSPTSEALTQAKKDNRRVEIESLRSESATVYANPDGKTLRMELHSQPVRVKNTDGKGFTAIDTTLVEQGGVIKPKAINGTLTLSAGQDKTLLKSRATAGADTAKITTPSTLPKPTLKGNTARYPAAYGKGRDLLVTATATGFRQQVVITERPTGPVTFTMPVALPAGLSFSKNAQGRPIIVGKDSKTLTEVRPTLLQDATAADAYAPIDAGKVGKAAVSLDDDGKSLVFTPDATFLADPAVTYPVTMAAVAADWWESHTGAGGLPKQGSDTFVNDKDYPDSWDNFRLDRILVGKSNSGTVRWRSYIKFPDMPAEFRGLKVQNADLILWNHLSSDCGTYVGSGITTRRITSAWDEATMTWNSQPSVTSTGQITEYAAYSPNCTSGAASWAGKEWDLVYSIDEIVQAWSNGEANYGVQLTAGSESDSTNWRRYRTDEAGGCRSTPLEACKGQLHPPILTIDFEAPTPPRLETVVTTSREPLTSIPEYEEALTKSVYVPQPDELIEPLSDELIAANEGQRDGVGTLIGTDKLSPAVPYPGDSDDTTNPEGEDTTPPRVLATEPASGATDVSLDSRVRVTFSEEIFDPQVVVKSAQGVQIQGTTTLDDTKKIATFSPTQPLHPGTAYTVEISGAIDASENEMVPYTWSFRTIDQAAAHWTFDEGTGEIAADSSGNDHKASLSDTAAWITGKSGHAISNMPSQARIAASRAAAQQGKAVAVADETTATSITYAQPDGKTFKTEVTTGPVRARQGSGWTPIDTTLAEQGGKLRPKTLAEGAVVEISAGGTDPFVKMSADGKSYALRWPTPLPKPTVKGSVATYTDAAGVGADLVVTALPAGFRHEVVLRQRPAKPLELRIGVEDDGLTLTRGKGGRLLLKGKDKKTVVSAPRPLMWDGSAEGRRPLAKSVPVSTEVTTRDGRTELVVKPDHHFMADSATTYPVRIQPMAASTSSEDLTLASTDTVDSPAYPDGPVMIAGVQQGQKMRSYLRFPTGSLQGQTVTDAKLSLYNIVSSACGASVSDGLQVRRVTGAWNADNLYWANKPAATTEDAQINKAGYDQSCAEGAKHLGWNVTAIAQDWAAGAADHGLVVQSPTEGTTTNWRYLTASEDTDFNQPPTLTITTSGPASQPVVSNLAITPAQSVNGVTVTTSFTPQLAATVADTASGRLTGEFEVEHDPGATGQGTGQIWAGASAVVTSGGQATVSVPTGRLADGWKIRWRARAANATAATTSAWSAWQTATVDVPNPTVGAFQVTPSQVVNGVTVTTSLTPALRTTVTDPAAQPVRAEFEVEHDPAATGQGTGQIWTGAVDNVPSGTQASATIADGKLTDGWKVRWRVRAVNPVTTVGSPWSDWQALTVDVPDQVSEPAVGVLQVTPSTQADGTTVTPTRTPALLAQVSDPANKPLRAEAEIEHDPAAPEGQGSGQIWTGSADNVPAGTQATITVAADKLADGWKVRWRARAVSSTAASAWSEWQSFTVSLPKPTATGLTVTPSKVVNGVTVTTALTPTLQATLTHPAGQASRAEAEIEHDPAATGQGTGQIWTGATDNVASGTQVSMTVPAGKLADGWKVRWRLRAVAGDVSSAWSDWQQITVDVTQPGQEPLAQTTGPVIRTDQSFTAAAWLRWSDKDGDHSVLEQKGTHQAPFRLGNTPDHGLVFTFTSADTADATVEGVLSGVEPPVGEWFHVAGVYDADTRTATLYVNGAQAGTAQLSTPVWNAQASLRIGAAMAGSIDEVRIFQRPLSADEVASAMASAPTPVAEPAPQKTTSTQAVAATGGFDYERINLQTCQVSGSETGHGEYDARIRELPYNSCWSSYLQVNDYVEDESSGRWVKAGCKSVFKNPVLKWACKQLDEPFDEDIALRFRATVVIHSYLGNATGTGVVGGSGTGLKPTDMKMFIQLDDFVLIGEDGRVLKPGDQLNGLPITTRVYIPDPLHTDEGCATGDGEKKKDISGWQSSPYDIFNIRTTIDDPGVVTCAFSPEAVLYTDLGVEWLRLPLFSEKVIDVKGKWVGVARHGDDMPVGWKRWMPHFRCDSLAFGASDPQVEDRVGGCINTRSKRVFVMSTGSGAEFPETAQHIKDALNPATNKSTYPPKRAGEYEVPNPPIRAVLGTEQPKRIPGNWAAPVGSDAGEPLHRTTDKIRINSNNRVFAQRAFISEPGTANEKEWPDNYGSNYCKYYQWEKYVAQARFKDLNCDEYPFKSTLEGAASTDWDFSIRAIKAKDNQDQGNALGRFYADFRVGNENSFWVMID
ncbi:DNRLRE domain-containing protein [Nonomuraea rhodomycinica]|uniref:DNRLRE domain-containing protein n=1 Tax=Nonomuraea rhodomycinica TaxID=1712872 RepID=A0A7Y6IN32_9ACTN|nr:DNRLRE domain-containing protein [Nonomuraea rhodomycinica]NUW41023.1 DNRLRE domain-containing protein [Nonomuraea rhodomycinica]